MRTQQNLNATWQFHLGEIGKPRTTAKKAYALGGPTALFPAEGERLPISAGGTHFLKLIAQGDVHQGLQNLAGTDLSAKLPGAWTTLNLPHDWKAELPYQNDPALLMAGGKPDGVGYYRKVFTCVPDPHTKVLLHFDGVVRAADVWLNGAFLGHNQSGYTAFTFDITPCLQADRPNVLLVRADTTTGDEGWWYEGAGIYRDVWLETVPEIHLNADDAFVYTKSLTHDQATLGVEASVTNDGDDAVTTAPSVTVAATTVTFAPQSIAPGQTAHYHTEATLTNVTPWTPEDPHCYQVEFALSGDRVTKPLGIHTFAYTPEGFFLNGTHYPLRGVCEHQDFVGVGVALTQDLVDYKIKALKAMGVNALRSAHHFASPQLLDACDRLGILLIDENRLLEATPWRQHDLTTMVKKHRMHPSVAFWSLANEEVIGNTAFGAGNLKRFAQLVHRLDPQHLIISAELLNPQGEVDDDYLQWIDVLGLNYPEAGVMGDGALKIRQTHPQLPLMSTESGSYFQTRGSYRDDAAKAQANSLGSMYSMVLPGKRQPGDPGVGGTAHPETTMAFAAAHPEFGGVFLWTAFDYAGEPSPFAWPGIGSQFGMLDTCGFPKAYYYYFQAKWTTQPLVHIANHWNGEGLTIAEDGTTPVRVFTNAASVELKLNGHSLGKQTVVDNRCEWQVTYAPGKLEAFAYDASDQLVATTQRVTAGPLTHLALSTRYQGAHQTLWQIQALDADDQPVPLADAPLAVTVQNGTIIALGNGDPAANETPSRTHIRLFNGKALVIATNGSVVSTKLA